MASFEQRLAAIQRVTDPVERFRLLTALQTEGFNPPTVRGLRAAAVREVARSFGPRNWGPREGRDYNWDAAGRALGITGWRAQQIALAAPPEPAPAVSAG